MNRRVKVAAAFFVAVCVFLILNQNPQQSTICFKESCVKLEIADDDLSRTRGLMFRESLPADEGMLFIFDSDGDFPFWMKNTLIPLDMVWLGSDLRVVHIEYALPCKQDPCVNYDSQRVAKYVLEVNGGYTTEHGIRVGDRAVLRLS